MITAPNATSLTLQVSIVIEIVSKHYGYAAKELIGAERWEPLATNRQVAMYLARKHTPASLPFLAHCFKKKHHCTVLHAVTTIERKRKADKALAADIEALAAKIKPALT